MIRGHAAPIAVLMALGVVSVACGGGATSPAATPSPLAGQTSGPSLSQATVPPVQGFVDGREILFIHTEASDARVAGMLTAMMSSPVLVVPTLAQVPDSALANVYVFTNGIGGHGPFGFQPDVFDSPPGSEGYSPLRRLHLVTWNGGRTPRELRSATEVNAAEAAGDVAIELPGVVVNMPFLTWPGGQR